MAANRRASIRNGRNGPIMVPAILKAVLDDCAVSGDDLIDLLDERLSRGWRDFDSRDGAVSPSAALLPPMQVEPAADQGGTGPHLLFHIDLGRLGVSLLAGTVQVRISKFHVPHTVVQHHDGGSLAQIVSHELLDDIDVTVTDVRREGEDTVIDVLMPMVALVPMDDRVGEA